ncbi:MAG TPA: SAM-dependent methyltransferase [Clostridia bacterium]|nr:SAM-dependent methyltransferase [Clostridia bacterium]
MLESLEKKLANILGSIESRLEENILFFKGIDVEYIRSGKTAKAKVYINGDKLSFDFQKVKTPINPSDLSEMIIRSGKEYEDCIINYSERGSGIVISTEKNNVKINYTNKEQDMANLHDDVSARTNRTYLVRAGEADAVLREIGILTAEGKVKNDMIRKYNQIDHFVELVEALIKEQGDKENITVLDCACGKSYLSFVLNFYIKEKLKKNCYFIGLDISEQVISSSRKMAQNLGYKNMEFHQIDIQNYQPTKKIDIVISLHGCDVATDMAIAAGVRYEAGGIIVIPCCHRELLSQYEYKPFSEIIKYGVLKARIADALTDGIRGLLLEAMGYEASIVEYISPLDTPKNLMIRAVKKSARNRKAYEEYLRLKESLGINPALARLLNI